MNSKNKEKVFSVLSIIFYLLVVFSTFIILIASAIDGDPLCGGIYTFSIWWIIADMLWPLLLGSATVIRRERIVTGISIITCAAGTLCTLIFRTHFKYESIRWLIRGYLLLLLLVLLQILGRKTGKQKLCLILQKVIAALLFVNIAANIFIATKLWYAFFGIIWGNVYYAAFSVLNSLACAFWAMWYIMHSKYSEE